MSVTEELGNPGPDASEAGSGNRRRLKTILSSRLLRAAISLLLLAVLLTRIDLSQLADTLGGVSFGMLAVAVVVFLICNMVNIYKWRLIIRTQGPRISYFYLTTLYYMGLFFNNFLPTNIGGDVVKIWKLSRVTGQGHDALSSVVIDRAGSTLGILLLAVVPALFRLSLLGPRVAGAIFAMFLVAVLLVAFLSSERAVLRLGRFRLFRIDPFGLRRHLKSFYYSLYQFRDHKLTLVMVMLWSLIYQALHVLTVYFVALALGIDLPMIYYFLFIPVVMAVALIPLSLNGLGMREGAWVLLFGQVGLSSAEAFSMSILSFLVVSVVSLAGGVFYLFDRSAPPVTEEAAVAVAEEAGTPFVEEKGSGSAPAVVEEADD